MFAEHRLGKLASVVPEIIGAARELQKELSAPVSAILIGNGVRKYTDELLSLRRGRDLDDRQPRHR